MRPFIRTSWLFTALFITLLVGCKKTTDPVTPAAGPTLSLVGSWKITALTLSPGWVQYTNATPITDYIAHLKEKGETCLTDITVSFTSAGAISNNFGSLSPCAYASESKIIADYLSSDGSTFTETATQAILYNKGKTTAQTVSKSGTNQLMVIQFQNDEDISANKIKTTYTLTMARQ